MTPERKKLRLGRMKVKGRIGMTKISEFNLQIAATPSAVLPDTQKPPAARQLRQLRHDVVALQTKLTHAPKFLTETWQVKTLRPVIDEVSNAISAGKVTNNAIAQLYLDKITIARTNYDRLITRSRKCADPKPSPTTQVAALGYGQLTTRW